MVCLAAAAVPFVPAALLNASGCLLYTERQKVTPYNLLTITQQRSKLILKYFVGVLNVHVNIYLPSFISVRLTIRKLLKLNSAT